MGIKMIVDFTVVFNFIHTLWDAIGLLLLIGFGIAIPAVVVVASIVKIAEVRKAKLSDNGS